jgi:hypothetical protein
MRTNEGARRGGGLRRPGVSLRDHPSGFGLALMVSTSHRKADGKDVASPDGVARTLTSRLRFSFLVMGGVFALLYLVTRSLVAAGVVSGVLLLLSVRSILLHHRHLQRLERRLAEPDAVEVIEVRAARVLEVETPTGPALFFELSDGQILLMQGQWLLAHGLYRAPRPTGDGVDERFNSLDDPYGFPSDHFALHRWRGDGRPFWIEVRGRYLAPERSPLELPGDADIQDVERFPGTLATLQQDLTAALPTRTASRSGARGNE